ncbi:hypothetical protein DERF_009871 [Dermatophagoides farinae]|uniref:Uncharacterized protein n=1 Tax=Dermatophagoides farinae TaxID=6954 RepID=A0A922HXH2_DERFA|nr:hypothetical protein DERF_009871 [Dermatophagoides farinae]
MFCHAGFGFVVATGVVLWFCQPYPMLMVNSGVHFNIIYHRAVWCRDQIFLMRWRCLVDSIRSLLLFCQMNTDFKLSLFVGFVHGDFKLINTVPDGSGSMVVYHGTV